MKYDFDQVIDRHGTDSSKWDCGAKLLKGDTRQDMIKRRFRFLMQIWISSVHRKS